MINTLVHSVRWNSRLILTGKDPYVCRIRMTIVNVVVSCSLWVMFADQLRLAFFPASSDRALAIVNLAVWVVLVLELSFEAFIRPEGFSNLILSEKAFSPKIVLFINYFHLSIEVLSLVAFVPEFWCVLRNESCSQRYSFSFFNAALAKTIGPTRLHAAFGFVYFALIRLRVLGLIRHWKHMWISNTFIHQKWLKSKVKQRKGLLESLVENVVPQGKAHGSMDRRSLTNRDTTSYRVAVDASEFTNAASENEDRESALTNACNIGTALMVVNSYRTLAIMWAITGLFPLFLSFMSALRNDCAREMTGNLQQINIQVDNTNLESCEYLESTLVSWLAAVISQNDGDDNLPPLLSLEISPERCNVTDLIRGAARVCNVLTKTSLPSSQTTFGSACIAWKSYRNDSDMKGSHSIAANIGIRIGAITVYNETTVSNFTSSGTNQSVSTNYTVLAAFDQTVPVRSAAFASLLLQIFLLTAVLGGLSALRRDAEVLVLGPLRRMLRIVAQYAKNPLVPPKVSRIGPRRTQRSRMSGTCTDGSLSSSEEDSDCDSRADDFALGSYETEQLITAVAKITDLLRKCWGVAGADIISTNLASREGALAEVFNPTVPGKSVYALFGFAAIGGFENAVKNLAGDIMPLINDIAAVIHGEVFRWGFGDSGQCNKNLGGAFLMVFRIGLVKDVVKKLEEATNVVFNTKSSESASALKRKKVRSRLNNSNIVGQSLNIGSTIGHSRSTVTTRRTDRNATTDAMSLSLQSLPGITNFTDRAVIGMLKSYAGIYRDKKIIAWNNDFRLGAGVGAFSINMIYGMDAGWAVEGAVGSEYKIDATYLSPHVNMASRMTSACKQYGVTIMLSQAVQELMSDVAQSKLRHLDTVTVKGSSVKQKIFTYDAKARGVDFFLYSRSDEQADFDADQSSPNIWNTDQDLKSMRQHVSDEFLSEFKGGHKSYILGDWQTALTRFEQANRIMIQTVIEDGYLENEFGVDEDAEREEDVKTENRDGPSIYLINFIKSYGGVPPPKWDGWHPLTRK